MILIFDLNNGVFVESISVFIGWRDYDPLELELCGVRTISSFTVGLRSVEFPLVRHPPYFLTREVSYDIMQKFSITTFAN